MIKLSLPTEPFWLDLPGGAKVKVRPLTMPLYHAAIGDARKRAHAEYAGLGGEYDDAGNAGDPILAGALFNGQFAQSLARYGIAEWQGVAAPDGAPAALSPDNASLLVQIPAVGTAFLDRYTATVTNLVAEGNA